jgi:lipopolysaccharide/colanic/teichoic acid biosynthesis glycosyltransferase
MGLLASGVKILEIESFVESLCQKIPPSEVDNTWLTKLDLRQRDPINRRVKRLLDLIFSVFGLLFSIPILLVSCFAIALESGFPLFFHQKRTGLLGQPYVLHKLRTMRLNAEEKGAEWAKQKDSRVTMVGRFLRKCRIDEIPQFWNVIKGEMSIVGPRPERPELENEINDRLPYWKCRYLLKPGLTGWAQIRYKYASDMESSEEKLAYDLYYVKNASLFLDLEIMLSTLRSLTKGSR